jgi:multidrug transporter EmrE-like cation transporter
MKLLALCMAVLCVLLSSAAQLLMKAGLKAAAPSSASAASAEVVSVYLHAFTNLRVWAGLGLYALSAVLWLWVLSRLDVSLAYPLVSLGFVVTMALGILVLGEPFSWTRVLACGLIVAGVLLLAADA